MSSGGRPVARPLPRPTLFLDECIGTVDVPEALKLAGIPVEVLLDHLPSNTPDEVWLPFASGRGWVIVTKDKWIRRRGLERAALMNAKVAAFVLTSGDLTGVEMGVGLVRAYPRVQKLMRDYVPPFIASVGSNGRVELMTTPERRGGVHQQE